MRVDIDRRSRAASLADVLCIGGESFCIFSDIFQWKMVIQDAEGDVTNAISDDCMMHWFKVSMNDAVLTLWPATIVMEDDIENVLLFFKNVFDIEPAFVGCVKTLPDRDEDGNEIEDTGGRIDFFFYVKMVDVPKFAIKRFKYGMRWWEDVYFNNGEDIYPSDFRTVYPNPNPISEEVKEKRKRLKAETRVRA